MKNIINWSVFKLIPKLKPLCKGEEDTLTEDEISEINRRLDNILKETLIVENLMINAEIRFRSK